MTVNQVVHQEKGLVKAFKRYQKRYLSVGKKPDVEKMLSEEFGKSFEEYKKKTKLIIPKIF